MATMSDNVMKWKPLCPDDFDIALPPLMELSKLTSKCQLRNIGVVKNNGYIGNFDLTKCRHITDLSDKLILESLGLSYMHSYILLTNDLLVKSSEKKLKTPEELGKTWTPTHGPWEKGMPE